LAEEFEQRLLANSGSQSLTAVRGRFNYLLTRKLTAIDRTYRLNDEQKQKLTLAAQGDLQRFEDWLARERRQIHRGTWESRSRQERAVRAGGARSSA
jgi:hypothetical protein